MSLSGLSDELLLEIVNFVKSGDCNRDLGNLASCSRHLNRVTTPILYRDIIESNERTLPLLLLTILKKPDLAEFVLNYEASEFEDGELDISGFSEESLEMFRASIGTSGSTANEGFEWFSRVERGEWQALTTLLLLNLPKLKVLDLASYGNHTAFHGTRPQAGTFGLLFKKAASRQISGNKTAPSLKDLKRLSVAYSDTEMGLGFEDVIPLLQLPSVTSIRVHMLNGEANFEGDMGTHLNTRKLEVSYSSIEPEALTRFLQSFPSLEDLFYCHAGGIVGCMEFLPQTLGAGIQHLKLCLKSLEILGIPEDTFDDERALGVGSLVGFESLVNLSTMQITLFGPNDGNREDSDDDGRPVHLWNILPKSIITLTLTDCGPEILYEFKALLERKTLATPNLKTVGFHIIGPEYDTDLAIMLTDQAKMEGVSLRLVTQPFWCEN
ncbi:hypothetical protein BKA65DRAFT_183655 [Rhexocercosporidium sp. MPI-PUGE-AT-0058]|nr:hypothetical protein BKA65DRAFT_183655 [Rhexocercosporidium sp. MPI-PUGE-AT-0058]